MKVLVAHPGTQHSHRLALELNTVGALMTFHTGLAFVAGGWADQCVRSLPSAWSRRLANRRIVGLPAGRLRCHPLLELASLWRIGRGADAQKTLYRRNETFQWSISDDAFASADAVVGFDTSSWILADRCGLAGVPLILDQSTGHPDAMLGLKQRVRERFPNWGEEMELRRPEVRQAELREHEQADYVVVASAFTRRTLVSHNVSPEKIRINPYGVDCAEFIIKKCDKERPLRFVFVGSISARKGIPLLIEAWRILAARDAELWLVGPASLRVSASIPKLPGLRSIGAVPHAEMPAILGECDVMVFPSYFEGFGLVILEAMACGLPVITTTATAGPDILTHGHNGWIMEPDSLDGLVEIMRKCLCNREDLAKMGLCARKTAEHFSWSAYGSRWMEILREACRA